MVRPFSSKRRLRGVTVLHGIRDNDFDKTTVPTAVVLCAAISFVWTAAAQVVPVNQKDCQIATTPINCPTSTAYQIVGGQGNQLGAACQFCTSPRSEQECGGPSVLNCDASVTPIPGDCGILVPGIIRPGGPGGVWYCDLVAPPGYAGDQCIRSWCVAVP